MTPLATVRSSAIPLARGAVPRLSSSRFTILAGAVEECPDSPPTAVVVDGFASAFDGRVLAAMAGSGWHDTGPDVRTNRPGCGEVRDQLCDARPALLRSHPMHPERTRIALFDSAPGAPQCRCAEADGTSDWQMLFSRASSSAEPSPHDGGKARAGGGVR